VRDLPLSTSFCTGSGDKFYQSGTATQGPWFNLSLQDTQPLWLPSEPSRAEGSTPELASALSSLFGWAHATPAAQPLTLTRDETAVYDGGCSLLCSGTMMPGSLAVVQLYACEAPAPPNLHIEYAYRSNSNTVVALVVVVKGEQEHECHVMAPSDEMAWQQIVCCDQFPCAAAHLSFVEQHGPLDSDGKVSKFLHLCSVIDIISVRFGNLSDQYLMASLLLSGAATVCGTCPLLAHCLACEPLDDSMENTS
jgi:hypothetical protein